MTSEPELVNALFVWVDDEMQVPIWNDLQSPKPEIVGQTFAKVIGRSSLGSIIVLRFDPPKEVENQVLRIRFYPNDEEVLVKRYTDF